VVDGMNNLLALIGGEEFSDWFEDVHADLFARMDGRPRRVVYLPTCAADDGEETVDYWCDLAQKRLSALGAQVDTPRVVDRESADNPEYARVVAEAGWIYLGGGYPHVAMRILPGTRVLEALYTALKRGVLLTGASGGAMLMCARSFVMTPELSEEASRVWETGAPPDWDPPMPPLLDCLGIIPRSFCAPHFNRLFATKWLEHGLLPAGHSLIGIDEQTALISEGNTGSATSSDWQVAGRGMVTLYQGDQMAGRYPSGEMVSFL
jgi:cyanophycinase-like exopeptidase